MTTYSKISGLKEAQNLLRKLPDRVQKRVMTSAVRSGATVLKNEIKKEAPRDDKGQSQASKQYGRLRDNLRVVRLKRNLARDQVAYRVDTGNAFWGYIIEFIQKKPWFRPAVDRAHGRALTKIKERVGAGVEREALKLTKGKR